MDSTRKSTGVWELPPIHLLDCYPVAANGLAVHVMPDEVMLFWSVEGGCKSLSHSSLDLDIINEASAYLPVAGARILRFVNGVRNTNDVIFAYSKEYGEDFNKCWVSLLRFLAEMARLQIIYFEKTPRAISSLVRVTGSERFSVPMTLAVELTMTCNLRCAHCYIQAGSYRRETARTDKLLEVLDQLHQNGLRIVELTGGEPTKHPSFREIIEFCTKRFLVVGILTNGTLIDDALADLLAAYRKRIIVGIALDSSKPEIHDKFRGVPGCWNLTTKAIRRLTDSGVIVRVSMSVNEDSVGDIEETLKLATSLNAKWFSYEPISPWGRGKHIKWQMSRCKIETLMEQGQLVSQEKYSGILAKLSSDYLKNIKSHGCGAGARNFVLGPTGNVRPCLIIDESYLVFGNLFKQPFSEVFGGEMCRRWTQISSPDNEACGNCRFSKYCNFCKGKGIIMSEAFEGGCRWARQQGLVHWLCEPGRFELSSGPLDQAGNALSAIL